MFNSNLSWFDSEALMPGSDLGPTMPSTSNDCLHHQGCVGLLDAHHSNQEDIPDSDSDSLWRIWLWLWPDDCKDSTAKSESVSESIMNLKSWVMRTMMTGLDWITVVDQPLTVINHRIGLLTFDSYDTCHHSKQMDHDGFHCADRTKLAESALYNLIIYVADGATANSLFKKHEVLPTGHLSATDRQLLYIEC